MKIGFSKSMGWCYRNAEQEKLIEAFQLGDDREEKLEEFCGIMKVS